MKLFNWIKIERQFILSVCNYKNKSLFQLTIVKGSFKAFPRVLFAIGGDCIFRVSLTVFRHHFDFVIGFLYGSDIENLKKYYNK